MSLPHSLCDPQNTAETTTCDSEVMKDSVASPSPPLGALALGGVSQPVARTLRQFGGREPRALPQAAPHCQPCNGASLDAEPTGPVPSRWTPSRHRGPGLLRSDPGSPLLFGRPTSPRHQVFKRPTVTFPPNGSALRFPPRAHRADTRHPLCATCGLRAPSPAPAWGSRQAS